MEIDFGIIDDIKREIAGALEDGAERIAEKSREMVPVASGELKQNCRVTSEDELSVTIGYDLPYAVIQHENLEAKHASGSAKFLEEPFDMEQSSIIEDAADRIARVIG